MSGDDFLAAMAASSRARVAAARSTVHDAAILNRALARPAPPRLTRASQRFDVIAEVKLRSPSAGQLRDSDEDVAARALVYAKAGAAAISVLTEPSRFDGDIDHLHKASVSLRQRAPTLRKDFLVDPYQVMEARAAGAGGVLLIVRMLNRRELEVLVENSTRLGMFTLLEIFDEADLEVVNALLSDYGERGEFLVGVNSRDLVTLQVVPGRLERLAPLLPREYARVAESGISTPADAARVAAAGYDFALVGSALMTAEEPDEVLMALLQAGREARAAVAAQ